ncbi:hypothetical protein ES319_A12G054200v1 [Gossypium barbadense]|uniref:ATP synthase F1 complex delta/epsilon subunit N-terminal domain-containing protein n=2 Tax=Gossypium TaxID=3633 RepID=A0A5J5T6D5_GOSBA|nr:hypothetical protein ES319_A12G054200v1 [Gossypium barbadense]TYG88893.1 hypothetical protein ES288_A12G057200v1 [Gossypium darwinii]
MYLCVLTPNRIVWDSKVKEIILSTNSGQIGVLPNHTPIATAADIGILRIRLNDQWLTMAIMGAQQALKIAEANLRKTEGKRQKIEANLALRLSRTRVKAINAIS